MPDQIHLAALELSCHIGVPDEERLAPQRLTAHLTLEPLRDFRHLEDSIENTVDYFQVAKSVQALARAKPRRLLETLAEEISASLLANFALRSVELELRKYILPDTAFVSVRLSRER